MRWFIRFAVSILLLAGASAAAPRLVFADDFGRESVGDAWRGPMGHWRLEDGMLAGSEKPDDGHGAVIQTYLDFSDLVLEFEFEFRGSNSFNVVIDDRHHRGSHAGHICRAVVSGSAIRIGDDKTGIMEKRIFAMRRDPARKAEAEALVVGKQKSFPVEIGVKERHLLRISIVGDTMSVDLDGRKLGVLNSPGIGHLTKTDFGFTVPGGGVAFDKVRAWLPRSSGDTFIYGASGETGEIVTARHDLESRKLEVVARRPLNLAAGPMAWHPDHRLVYVADIRPKADDGARGMAFAVREDGTLADPRELDFHHGYAYLSLDRTRRFLLAASYREGHVDVYRLDAQGLPSDRVATRFEGRDKAHAILASPDNRHVFVPYVKDQNALYQYGFDSRSGRLSPLDPASLLPPEDSGPRHLAYHPSRPLVFFSNEQQVGASSYRLKHDGQLEFLGLCEVLGDDGGERLSASDIALTRGGRFLFSGLRHPKGTLNAVCRYAVEDDGGLRLLGRTPAGAIPWCLQLSPDEGHLFVSATNDGILQAFALDDDGGLAKGASIEWARNIRDMVVVDLP